MIVAAEGYEVCQRVRIIRKDFYFVIKEELVKYEEKYLLES